MKFESKETNSIRLCRKIGDIFEPPEDGWGDRLYIVHSPMSQNVSTSGKFYIFLTYIFTNARLFNRELAQRF